MDVWTKVLKLAAALGGALAGVFGEWNTMLTVLAVVMTLDYLSGVIVAAAGASPKSEGGHLSSKAGFTGLLRKGIIIIIVLLATMLDRALGTDSMVFQGATTCYYIANEALSILENAALMGMPVPNAIRKALDQIKDQDE